MDVGDIQFVNMHYIVLTYIAFLVYFPTGNCYACIKAPDLHPAG